MPNNSLVALNHLAAVRLVQPAPAAVVTTEPVAVAEPNLAAIVVARQPDPLLTLRPSVTTRLELVRWINPILAAGIATLRPTIDGVPRNQITVPVSLTADISDEVLFEDPIDSDKKSYLPRYRIAERNSQVQISLAVNPQGWILTIDLEKYPAPAIEISARNAQNIRHEVSVILQHRLILGDANGGQKEWLFAPPVPNEGSFRSVLQMTTQSELNLLFQVLTTLDYGAVLTVRRTVKIGVPAYTPNTSTSASVLPSRPPRATCYPDLPAPQLHVVGTENYEAGGQPWTRYSLCVNNWSSFPDDLFEEAPDLPPCGLNRNASRTWVDIHAQEGTRLYGFCAFSSASDLKSLWFATPRNQTPPAVVYITLQDRRCNITYTSNSVKPQSITGENPNDGEIVSSGQGILRGTFTFNLDSGVEGGQPSDIWWNQQTNTVRLMVLQGQASLAYLGEVNFDALPAQQLQQLTYSKLMTINGSINAPQNNQLFKGSVFAVLTNNGNYAKVQILEYGYNLTIRWVTYRPPSPTEVLFREAIRVVDNLLQPRPFVFPQVLYPYIYQCVTGAGNQIFKPRRWSFSWQGKAYSYYQDPVHPQIIYYLPDCFKLVRRPESPHYPMVSIYFSSMNDVAEDICVTIEYWAFPFVDSARLNAATHDLCNAGVSKEKLLFQPLVADRPRLFLRLPQSDGSSRRQECADVPVELRTGFSDSLTFSLKNFQAIFEALFSNVTQLFQGEVLVDFPEGTSEIIPFRAQLDDLVGKFFDYTQAIDATTTSVQVILKNRIESPIRINRLVSFFRDAEAQIPGTISGLNLSLPADLPPEASLSCTITPERVITPESLSNLLFDLSDIKILPDRKAIYYAILRPDSPSSYKRIITIKIRKSVFGDRITDISIDFKQGDTVTISYEAFDRGGMDQLSVNATVLHPIGNLILREEDPRLYEFRTTVLLKNGSKIEDSPNQWRNDIAETLLLTTAELPPLPIG